MVSGFVCVFSEGQLIGKMGFCLWRFLLFALVSIQQVQTVCLVLLNAGIAFTTSAPSNLSWLASNCDLPASPSWALIQIYPSPSLCSAASCSLGKYRTIWTILPSIWVSGFWDKLCVSKLASNKSSCLSLLKIDCSYIPLCQGQYYVDRIHWCNSVLGTFSATLNI